MSVFGSVVFVNQWGKGGSLRWWAKTEGVSINIKGMRDNTTSFSIMVLVLLESSFGQLDMFMLNWVHVPINYTQLVNVYFVQGKFSFAHFLTNE